MVHNAGVSWQTVRAAAEHHVQAPDGSEIRLLVDVAGASMVHCRVPPGQVTRAVRHHHVEELWYCIAGAGQLWRKSALSQEVVDLTPGVAVTIPVGVEFQFRGTGNEPLEVVITTVPPWPGADEAVPAEGPWESTR